MTTKQLTGVSCDCPGGVLCPDPMHDAGEECENTQTIRTNRVDVARLTAMTNFGYSVTPALRGTYVVADLCRPCTDWRDVETRVRVGLRAMGFDVDGLDDILNRVRVTLGEPVGPT